MKSLASLFAVALVATTVLTAAESKDGRVYEMRTYYAAPGKLDDLNKRFREHTTKLFEKHGMQNIGYWVPLENPENKLVYIIAHKDRDSVTKSWRAFSSDPEWKAAQKASEANGRLVAYMESFLLQATDFSPELTLAKNGQRLFELRDYTASTNHLPDLDSRFRDHTTKLFAKHGMEQIAYWHLVPGQKGADRKLIYLLAHKSKEAAADSFAAFRKDPDWVAAKEASEKKASGPLTEGGPAGVKSTYLKPTDYSPMQ